MALTVLTAQGVNRVLTWC